MAPALSLYIVEARFCCRPFGQMPYEMTEVAEARLCERLVHGLNAPAVLGLEFKGVHVQLVLRHKSEARQAHQYEVWTGPLAFSGTGP